MLNLPEVSPIEGQLVAQRSPVDQEGNEGAGSSSNPDKEVDWSTVLPQKAALEEAESAIAKLDRMQAARDSQRKWLKATGLAGVVKSKASRRKREGEFGDEGAFTPSDDYSFVAMNLDNDSGELPGEVKLGITSIPGYSVLAVKGAASKTRNVVSRAAGTQRFFRARSPTSFTLSEEGGEDSNVSTAAASPRNGENARDLQSTTTQTGRRASFGARLRDIGSSRHRPTTSLDAQALSAMMNGDANGLTNKAALLEANGPIEPSSRRLSHSTPEPAIVEEDVPHDPTAAESSVSRPSFGIDELGAVQEDQHQEVEAERETAAEQTMIDKNDTSQSIPQQPRPDRPRIAIPSLHVQEPSIQSIKVDGTAPSSRSSSGAVRPVATRGALSLGGSALDDSSPESDERPDTVHQSNETSLMPKRVLPRRLEDLSALVSSPIESTDPSPFTESPPGSSTSSSSSVNGLQEEAVEADTTADMDADYVDSDDEDAEEQLASLSLEHSKALTNKELRKQLKRDKALPKESYGKAASLGHKVSRGLHYASNESRNRRAMEKYSPHPQAQRSSTADRDPVAGSSSSKRRPSAPSSATDLPLGRVSSGFEGGWNPSFTLSRNSKATSGSTPTPEPPTAPDASVDGEGGDQISRVGSPDSMYKHSSPNQAQASVDSFADESMVSRSGTLPRRWGTHRSMASSLNGDVAGTHLSAPRPWHFRQRRKWGQRKADESLVAADASVPSSPVMGDPEQELEDVLGKLAAEQAPEQAGEKYEWDVLYENQRGVLFFGVPKFSARTLMQWDPSAWTNSRFQNSPYNIVNAQLPDPSWEWVYPEFLIDMAGDVDEQGWQYSGNFGRNPFARLHHFLFNPMPKPGPNGDLQMTDRTKRKEEKRRKKEQSRADDGLEALKRSIKAKNTKWTGRPDPGSFVRRRRWIRLRRRKALGVAAATSPPAEEEAARKKTIGMGMTVPDGKSLVAAGEDAAGLSSSSSESSTDFSVENSEMDEEDEVSTDGEKDYASPYGKASGFLPRRTAGHLRNGPDPFEYRMSVRAAKRYRREFTGTLRELKNLLPSLLDPRAQSGGGGHGSRQSARQLQTPRDLALLTIDARNPFISWTWVKKRLMDDDMSWKTTTLRQQERRYQQRKTGSHLSLTAHHPDRAIPSAFDGRRDSADISRRDFALPAPSAGGDPGRFTTTGHATTLGTPFTGADAAQIDMWELTRDALVEINFVRVKRVLRACKVDRQRLDLWRLWLGVDASASAYQAKRKASVEPRYASPPPGGDRRSSLTSMASPPPGGISRSGTRLAGGISSRKDNQPGHPTGPEANDVWDVLERRLDALLFLFEFNASRATLLRLLLSVHNTSHSHHRYRNDHTWRLRDLHGHKVKIDAPRELDPRRNPTENGGPPEKKGSGESRSDDKQRRRASTRAPMRETDWVVGLTSRLQFASDVHSIAQKIEDDLNGEVYTTEQRTQPHGSGSPLSPSALLAELERKADETAPSPRLASSSLLPSRSPSPAGAPAAASLGQTSARASQMPRRTHSPALDHYNDLGLHFAREDGVPSRAATTTGLSTPGENGGSVGHHSLYWQQQQQRNAEKSTSSSHGRIPWLHHRASPVLNGPSEGSAGHETTSASASSSDVSHGQHNSRMGEQGQIARSPTSSSPSAEAAAAASTLSPPGRQTGSVTIRSRSPLALANFSAASWDETSSANATRSVSTGDGEAEEGKKHHDMLDKERSDQAAS